MVEGIDPLIRHSRNEKGIGAQMCPAMFSGVVTGDTAVSYWPNFSLSLETVPGVFAANVPPLWVSCSVCDVVIKWGVAFLSLTGVEYLVALYLNQDLCSTAEKT